MLHSTNFPPVGVTTDIGLCGRVEDLRREAARFWDLAAEWRGSAMELVAMMAAARREVAADAILRGVRS